jgi:hypothetical protein
MTSFPSVFRALWQIWNARNMQSGLTARPGFDLLSLRRDHGDNGKSLQLFEQDKKDKRFLRYLGEMEYVHHSLRDAPDTDGNKRKAIVFHLRPVGTLSPDSAVVAAALAGEAPVSGRAAGGGFGSVETNRRVEKAAIEFVKQHYEKDGWSVGSVEAQKVGYDLCCDRGDTQVHIEVKGTQGEDVCFIITAAEVRNTMIDRKHLTCVVTGALAPAPRIFTYTKDEFSKNFQLAPIAFRAQLLPE